MENKRTFARVDARIYFACQAIDTLPENWRKTSRLYLGSGLQDASDIREASDVQDMFALIYAALSEIKEDLRRIKAHMGIEETGLRLQDLQISGSGVSFYGAQAYKPGQHLLLSMVLPFELPIIIQTVGEIVDVDSGVPGSQLNRIKFVLIHEEDRELIVKYTFQRQRELINIHRDASTP